MADSRPLNEVLTEDDPMLALGELIERRAIIQAELENIPEDPRLTALERQ